MFDELLSSVLAAGQAVLEANPLQVESLEKAESYAALLGLLLEEGGRTEEELQRLVALHHNVMEVLLLSEGRGSVAGARRNAVKAYLANLVSGFKEG